MVIKDKNVPAFKSFLNSNNTLDPIVPPLNASKQQMTVFATFVSGPGAWIRLSPAQVSQMFSSLYDDSAQSWNDNVSWVWWYTSNTPNIPSDLTQTTLPDGSQLYTNPTYPGGEVPLLTTTSNSSTQCMCRESYNGGAFSGSNTSCNWNSNYLTAIRAVGQARFGSFYAIATSDGRGGCASGASRVLFLQPKTPLSFVPYLIGKTIMAPSSDQTSLVLTANAEPLLLTSLANVKLYQLPAGVSTDGWLPSQAIEVTTLTDVQIQTLVKFAINRPTFTIAFPLTNTQQQLLKSNSSDGSFFVAMFDMTNPSGTTTKAQSRPYFVNGGGNGGGGGQIPIDNTTLLLGGLIVLGVVFVGYKIMSK